MELDKTDVTSTEEVTLQSPDFVEQAFLGEESSSETTEEVKEEKSTEEPEAQAEEPEVNYEKRFKDTQRAFNKERELNKLIVSSLENGDVIDDERLAELKAQVEQEAEGVMPEDFTTQLNQQLESDLQLLVDATDGEEADVKEAIKAFGTIGLADPDKVAELKALEGSRRSLYIVREGKKMLDEYKVIAEAGSPVEAIRKLKSSQEELIAKAEKYGYDKAKKELEAQYAEFVPASGKPPRASKQAAPKTEDNPEKWLGDFLQS